MLRDKSRCGIMVGEDRLTCFSGINSGGRGIYPM